MKIEFSTLRLFPEFVDMPRTPKPGVRATRSCGGVK